MKRWSGFAALLLVASACSADADARPEASGASGGDPALTAAATSAAPAAAPLAGDLPTIVVYKSPTCGCCKGWVSHLEEAGFRVEARDVDDVNAIKLDAGVPSALSSCHTGLIDGYFVEGHVPASEVKRLLAERPDVAGITVPGMPMGSPGMEGPNARPYQVLTVDRSGGSAVYATIDPNAAER